VAEICELRVKALGRNECAGVETPEAEEKKCVEVDHDFGWKYSERK
jgi:hypothetical protein